MHLIQQKLKLSFSKSRLEDKIDELRKYNGDLRVLTSQIERLHSNGAPTSKPSSLAAKQYQSVQKASLRLYESLSSLWSCAAHTSHAVSIGLEPSPESSLQNVRFQLAVTSVLTSGTIETPLWLSIESSIDQSTAAPQPMAITDRDSLREALRQSSKAKTVKFSIPERPRDSVSSSSCVHDNHGMNLS